MSSPAAQMHAVQDVMHAAQTPDAQSVSSDPRSAVVRMSDRD